jgi:prophage antirepressor-like protein
MNLQTYQNDTFRLTAIVLDDGRPAWLAGDIAEQLGYSRRDRVGSYLRKEWSEEFEDGVEFTLLAGEALAKLKETPNSVVASSASSALVLFEAGVNAVCLLTKKPTGRTLRRFMAREVMPQIARTGSFAAAKTVAEDGAVVDRDASAPEGLAERREARLRAAVDLEARKLQVQALEGMVDILKATHAPPRHLVPWSPSRPRWFGPPAARACPASWALLAVRRLVGSRRQRWRSACRRLTASRSASSGSARSSAASAAESMTRAETSPEPAGRATRPPTMAGR